MRRLVAFVLSLCAAFVGSAPVASAQAPSAPRLVATDGRVVAPSPNSLCLTLRAPNDSTGTLVATADARLREAFAPLGYTLLPEGASCAYQLRLTMVRNLNAQRQTLSVALVATVARRLSADGLADPLNALAGERLSAGGQATVRRLHEAAPDYERFVGTDVSSVSSGLAAGLGRLAGRLHTTLLASPEE